MKKHNIVYKRNGIKINISTDNELNEHLKRHVTQMILNNKSTDHIMKWIHDKGISVEIDSEMI